MDATQKIILDAARTAAVPVLSSLAGALYDEIDKLVATHDPAETAAPWLVKARQAASDVMAALGSHATAETPAAPAPAPTAPAPANGSAA